MSIPLDRLYNYLDSIIEDDIIIYRFFPHGSRKLEDLLPLYESLWSWSKRMDTPYIIFHDQEPLNFEYYATDYLRKLAKIKISESGWDQHSNFLLPFLMKMNIRLAIQNVWNYYDYTLLCHSEKNSSEVNLYRAAGFIGVYWWCHAIIAKDWFRYAEHDLTLLPDFNLILKDFLIYNRAWSGTREYRLTMSELLAKHNLLDHCNISFSATDNGQHYSDYIFKNKNLGISNTNLENIYKVNQSLSSASADYHNKDYIECGIEVVLETLFDDTRQHLTEKALRPIACGRPFILAATPGSLQYLRDYGFETFSGLINETYDTILDPKDRLIAIVSEMERISMMDVITKNQLWLDLYKIAERNKQRFFSKEFNEFIVNEFKINISAAIKIMNKHKTGKHWLSALNESLVSEPSFKDTLNKPVKHRSPEDVKKVQEWLKLNNK